MGARVELGWLADRPLIWVSDSVKGMFVKGKHQVAKSYVQYVPFLFFQISNK